MRRVKIVMPKTKTASDPPLQNNSPTAPEVPVAPAPPVVPEARPPEVEDHHINPIQFLLMTTCNPTTIRISCRLRLIRE